MKIETLLKAENTNTQKVIMSKIRDLINFKNLEPGEKLPSERMLSERFGVTRSNVRLAIQKLEFYGLLDSVPQSGTMIANIGVVAINGLIDDILKLEDLDFKSLVETRICLELKMVKLATKRRTEEDLVKMRELLDAYTIKVLAGQDAVQEDLLFHLAIAKASGNSTMNIFMLVIIPEIITNFAVHHVCDENLRTLTIKEHQEIYYAIKDQKTKLAKKKMKKHFRVLYQYCYDKT